MRATGEVCSLTHSCNTVRLSASSTSSISIASIIVPNLNSSKFPNPSGPSSSASRNSSQRLSTGAVAGIAVGLSIVIILAIGALFYLWRRRRTDREAAEELFDAKKYRGTSPGFPRVDMSSD